MCLQSWLRLVGGWVHPCHLYPGEEEGSDVDPPNSKAMSALIDGVAPNGKFLVIGATFDPIELPPVQIISGGWTIQGWAAGTPADSEDTPRFAKLTGVRPMIETYPLEKADEAYARMMSGKTEFRVVLTV